jgi:hypothetical protein
MSQTPLLKPRPQDPCNVGDRSWDQVEGRSSDVRTPSRQQKCHSLAKPGLSRIKAVLLGSAAGAADCTPVVEWSGPLAGGAKFA